MATGHTNAAAEGVNRLIKLVYRTGFGFRDVTSRQRRSRYTASRRTRPTWAPAALPRRPRGRRPDPVPALAASTRARRHLTGVTVPVMAEDPRPHIVTEPPEQPVAA